MCRYLVQYIAFFLHTYFHNNWLYSILIRISTNKREVIPQFVHFTNILPLHSQMDVAKKKKTLGSIGRTKGGILSCCLCPNENDKLPNQLMFLASSSWSKEIVKINLQAKCHICMYTVPTDLHMYTFEHRVHGLLLQDAKATPPCASDGHLTRVLATKRPRTN